MRKVGAPADRVLIGGTVITMESGLPRAEALAIHDGLIVDVGSAKEIEALVGPSTEIHRLQGGLVLPGFFDSHNHMLLTGLGLLRPSLGGAQEIREVLDVVRSEAQQVAPGDWIQTSPSWHESQLRESRLPTAEELDSAAPHNPVFMRRGGHNVVLNSAAFQALGLRHDTPNPDGGTLVRNEHGNLTGHVVGIGVVSALAAQVPKPSEAEVVAALDVAGRRYAESGITSVIEPGLQMEEIESYQRLAATGDLPVRVRMMLRLRAGGEPVSDAVALINSGEISRFRDDWCSLFGLKLGVDGGVETGYYREPYENPDDPDFPYGKPLISPDDLAEICIAAARNEWHVGVHCVGDAGIDIVLDAFEAANAVSSIEGRRWSLIHMMYPHEDHWERVNRLKLTITAQEPLHYALGAGFQHYLGEERAAAIEPLRAYLEHNDQPVGGGSDSPVAPYEPLLGIASSKSRATRAAGILGPDWAISIEDAVRMYTTGSAWCAFEETYVGSIAVGKEADIAVLSRNVIDNPALVDETDVTMTIAGGHVTYSAS